MVQTLLRQVIRGGFIVEFLAIARIDFVLDFGELVPFDAVKGFTFRLLASRFGDSIP